MKCHVNVRVARLFKAFCALAAAAIFAGHAVAGAPSVNESELLNLGFKVLVATTKAQQDWVRGLVPGKIRPMQRTGKKFFIYPDASKGQVYVGGPAEYDAYRKLHPEGQSTVQGDAAKASAYRNKQDATMRAATAHDLSDPFLGVSWADLGW